MSTPRTGLRRRLLLGLLGYVIALTLAVIAHGLIVNEHAEQLVWQTLLDSELDHLIERSRSDPDYRWIDSESMRFYDGRDPSRVPAALRGLEPGVYDELMIDGIERVVLVREVDGRPLILALDIKELEQREFDMGLTVAGSALTLLVLLGLAVAWGVDRLVSPLSRLAQRIAQLQPDHGGQRVELPESASAELAVIADALNEYLRRNDRFVERERTFIDSASHELRTPIAVIAGAAELALAQPEVPPATRAQLARIRRITDDVTELLSLLLALAKDPARLARSSERIDLAHLLPEIVEAHRHLSLDKDLRLTVAPLPTCVIHAPVPIVRAAIGNLLRNAIEHSDRGEVRICLEAPATVVIDDPGHGMSPEEISAIYAQIVRGGDGERARGGIGLELISRLCEHLDWQLDIASDQGQGTTSTLRFFRE